MGQNYKAVYFADLPADTSKQRSITLAFGQRTGDLYEFVKDLSSTDIRQLLGTDSHRELMAAAQAEDLPLNTYCLRRLRQSLTQICEGTTQYMFPGMGSYRSLFDPVIATFRGGSKEPFSRWYPYLEGYSMQYVQAIMDEYAPNAQVVLDPFAGTGTTAFTTAQLGKQAYFCEVNPVLQFITLVKIQVRRLKSSRRISLAEALVHLGSTLGDLGRFKPEVALGQAYDEVFGDSEFFDPPVYEEVLRVRQWIDYVACEDPLLADLLTIAVLSALVPASKLKRAGDLRYKTPREYRSQTPTLMDSIRQNIMQIARDVREDVNGLQTEPLLICEDARSLANIPYLGVDTVITSPPYVNGTNYFRNTKIELWFLRCLRNRGDLVAFRLAAVTAGINDVTVAKVPIASHPEVEQIVHALEQAAYDSRIPRMIACYFTDMTAIFGAICGHLASDATVAVDIGDSNYAGVHVPVDKLLVACLDELGLALAQEIILRRRRSRTGAQLKQSLLIFTYRTRHTTAHARESTPSWTSEWEAFKGRLPHQQPPYASRNWGHPLHSLCSYPGKLKPAIAHHLVKIFVPANGRVLDPFAGVGTIPFEAALQGKHAYGFELSPAAFVIGKAKLQKATVQECGNIIQALHEFIECNTPTEEELSETHALGFNGKIAEYYESRTLQEVLLARRYFLLHPPQTAAEVLVLASLLHILHGNRPYALSRRSHPLTPYKPTGEFEYRPLLGRLQAKVNRSLQTPHLPTFQTGAMFFQDATGWWPREIDRLDAVITSPPFFDSTRFYLANWLRLWFAGWSARDFETRPLAFVDERQKQSFEIYAPILRQARERLKPDGVVVLHLGKSKKCDMAAQLREIGLRWFRAADVFDESVAHCESHGIRDKGAVTSHQYLVLY